MKTNIGLTEKESFGSAELLNRLLADEFILYVKTRNYHWNVTGMHFRSLHQLFEEMYGELDERIDEVAERVRFLGFRAFGTVEQYKAYARLKESPDDQPDSRTMLRHLLDDHEALIRHVREDLVVAEEKYHDAGTSDFLTAILEKHEKTAWMLRAYLEPDSQ